MPLAWDNVTTLRFTCSNARSTFEMQTTGLYPKTHIDAAKVAAVGQAGGVLLTETIRASGLDRALSRQLAGWRIPLAITLWSPDKHSNRCPRKEPPPGQRVFIRADRAGVAEFSDLLDLTYILV